MPSPRSQFPFTTLAAAAARVGLALAGLVISGTIMAQECLTSGPLTLKDTQDGFAGETGTVWTIAPDCSFKIARQIGLKILGPHKQGRLTAEQQARLKDVLDRVAVAGLAKQLGAGSQVNARRITLSYGGKESVLTLAPGGGDLGSLRAAAGNDPAGALLELADTVKGMTDS
jgi:hypothetical protein